MPNLLALNGSPVRKSSVDLLLDQVCAGYREAGGEAEPIYLNDLWVKPCQACGVEPTSGYCIFHDDMDLVYQKLERADAVAVGSPIFFDAVSAQLKLVIDRCNCITPLVPREGGGEMFRAKWARTRRGVFVTVSGPRQRYDMAERCVRGFMKWVGTKWEETLVFAHEDNELGSVVREPELLERAREVGRRLATSGPLEPSSTGPA